MFLVPKVGLLQVVMCLVLFCLLLHPSEGSIVELIPNDGKSCSGKMTLVARGLGPGFYSQTRGCVNGRFTFKNFYLLGSWRLFFGWRRSGGGRRFTSQGCGEGIWRGIERAPTVPAGPQCLRLVRKRRRFFTCYEDLQRNYRVSISESIPNASKYRITGGKGSVAC